MVGSTGARSAGAAMTAVLALAVATAVSYAHPLGHTTEEQQIGPAGSGDFVGLQEKPGSPRILRTIPGSSALAGRDARRTSIAYFAQLTDFQLADEEAPARVEFSDPDPSGTASAAWRPQEAFQPWAIDWSFRQLNRFTANSPHTQAGGKRAQMDFGLLTGDQSDNQQRNETIWVRQLAEGGQTLDPNSGTSSFANTTCSTTDQAALGLKYPDLDQEAANYTGVSDYSDNVPNANFYDPNSPTGPWSAWPRYQGLLDRAQKPFVPAGLRRGSTPVPTYVTNGNHDGLVQGNEDAVAAYERINIGCFKPFVPNPPPGGLDPTQLPNIATGFFVPPDFGRRFVDRIELKKIYRSGTQADDHGFQFIDPAENRASDYVASYYAWNPKPGLRFISIDTVSDGGTAADSADGNIDDPQWHWLERQLDAAQGAGKLIVVFGHHPIRTLDAMTPDEAASPCSGHYSSPTGSDEQAVYGGTQVNGGHDPNPGCDLDPRNSQPLHHGEDLVSLLSAHRNVVAYVAGHTHENKVLACGSDDGCAPSKGNWWEINTSATADWPQQHRLVELMNNQDGTLSIFGTTLDHGSKVPIPAATTSSAVTAAFDGETLAAIGRNFSFNDPQAHRNADGAPQDRNVELLVDDPRTRVIRGTPGPDVIVGTPGPDVIICGDGDDIVYAGGGDDIVRCGRGNDFVDGGDGNDHISGDQGNDRLLGGRGNDRIYGRSGRDTVRGQSGRDRTYGGTGNDRMSGGSGNDRMGGSSGRDRMNGSSGRDRMAGQGGNDRMAGGSGRDRMSGGSGRDRMAGQGGNDRLSGGRGRDRLLGGRGNDLLIGGPGRDRIVGGPGRDRKRR